MFDSFVCHQEEEEHDEGHESESDDEETVLYNPKNLPLGWDGKVRINDKKRRMRYM